MDASDALVAPREHPETRASSRRARTAFPAFASTKTASTAPSAFHRQVLSERHRSRGASSFDESPPPISRLCHRNPASDAPSPLQMLSHGTARPLGFNRKLFACGRLKGRAPPVDFCNLDRSASTTFGSNEPHVPLRRSPAGSAPVRGWLRWVQRGSFRHPHWSAANRDFTGQRSRAVDA